MERYNLDEGRAFAVLRRYSQDHNVKLHEVARLLIETRQLPRQVPTRKPPDHVTCPVRRPDPRVTPMQLFDAAAACSGRSLHKPLNEKLDVRRRLLWSEQMFDRIQHRD